MSQDVYDRLSVPLPRGFRRPWRSQTRIVSSRTAERFEVTSLVSVGSISINGGHLKSKIYNTSIKGLILCLKKYSSQATCRLTRFSEFRFCKSQRSHISGSSKVT